MNKSIKDAIALGFLGLIIGLMVGVIVASGHVVFKQGGDISKTEGYEILNYGPWVVGKLQEPFETGLVIILVAGVLGSIIFAAISYRPHLTNHGSARWAVKEDLKKAGLAVHLDALSGPIFAKLGPPKSRTEFITSHSIPHSFICAPTGSGKGVGIVIPTLLTYGGSVICLDIKGENYQITSRARQSMGDKIYRFSPLDEEGKSHRFNPLDGIAELAANRQFTEAKRIAESFIVMSGDNVQGFLVSAKDIFAAAVLVVVEIGTPTIGAVYDILSEGGNFNKMFEQLADETEIPESKSIFTRMSGIADRTLSAYMSVLFDGGLGIWRDAAVRAATEASDFTVSDLRRNPASIYIVVAPNDLSLLAPVIRLLFQQTVAILQQSEPGEDEPYPVLFLLDEFPQLGKMNSLSNAISTIRSYGGRMMIVAQSLSNLKAAYGPDGAQNFLANCRLQLFMAPADSETPDYVSKAIGDFTRKSRSKSWTMGQLGKSNIQERQEGARLLRPEELRGLSADDCVLLIHDSDPVLAKKVRYYEDKVLKKIFEDQSGDHPMPTASLESSSVETDRQTPKSQPPASPIQKNDDEYISEEDLQRMKSDQSDLLVRLRKAKKEVNAQVI